MAGAILTWCYRRCPIRHTVMTAAMNTRPVVNVAVVSRAPVAWKSSPAAKAPRATPCAASARGSLRLLTHRRWARMAINPMVIAKANPSDQLKGREIVARIRIPSAVVKHRNSVDWIISFQNRR